MEEETARRNFTFAELEENEQDLQKLAGWLQRIRARDFFGGARAEEAGQALAACQRAFDAFARAVYVAAGLTPADEERDERSP